MKKITRYLHKTVLNRTGYFLAVYMTFCVLSVLQPVDSMATEQIQHAAWLSAGENLSLQKNSFSIYDKVYFIVRFQDLVPGEYTISSDWLNPEGQLEQQNSHTFHLKKQSNYTYYAWLSLLKNGPLKRMLTGSDIERKFQGSWQLLISLNGQNIDTLTFDMH